MLAGVHDTTTTAYGSHKVAYSSHVDPKEIDGIQRQFCRLVAINHIRDYHGNCHQDREISLLISSLFTIVLIGQRTGKQPP